MALTMSNYPVMLNLTAQRCLVVGGGQVATRKISNLLAAQAQVIVISPQATPTIVTWAEQERLTLHPQPYVQGMVAHFKPRLVFAATNQPAVNQQVSTEAQALAIWVNRADDPTASDFQNMAVQQRGGITLSVSTQGAAPLLARLLSEQLLALLGAEYVQLAALCEQIRPQLLTQIPHPKNRESFCRELLQSAILDYLRQGDLHQAQALLTALQHKWANT
jgi:siroheme synthase-like protein